MQKLPCKVLNWSEINIDPEIIFYIDCTAARPQNPNQMIFWSFPKQPLTEYLQRSCYQRFLVTV